MQQHTSKPKQRLFTASEVAEFEYCPLAWWHEHFEPIAQANSDELFARLVELEHEHGQQAPDLPEYQTIEQLLLRQGAFDEGRAQHLEHAEEVEEIEQEVQRGAKTTGRMRVVLLIAVAMLLFALILIAAAVVLR
jgi:hypothetical protein